MYQILGVGCSAGEADEPPPIAPARGPLAWDDATEPVPEWGLTLHLDPETHRAILAAAKAAGKQPD